MSKSYNPDNDRLERDLKHFDWNKVMSEDKRMTMLRSLRDTCKDCVLCSIGREMCTRNHKRVDPHVFSNMNKSKIIIIGQNPGYNECVKDTPFVGEAGLNFNKEINKYGICRDDFYITNICKCLTPDNRAPTSDEIKKCFPYLLMELSILKPKIVITLGASSFGQLCSGTYSKQIGKFTYSEKIDQKVFAIYHPSPRNLSSDDRYKKFKRHIELLCGIMKHIKNNT